MHVILDDDLPTKHKIGRRGVARVTLIIARRYRNFYYGACTSVADLIRVLFSENTISPSCFFVVDNFVQMNYFSYISY